MRRVLVLLVGVFVLVPPGGPTASAVPERYTSKGYNAFWHSRHRIDRDTFMRTTWYAGVYVSEEAGESYFWSDLTWKSSERCGAGKGARPMPERREPALRGDRRPRARRVHAGPWTRNRALRGDLPDGTA
jgi:hypothetical protein